MEQESLRSAMKNNVLRKTKAATNSPQSDPDFRFVHNDVKLENILFGKFSNERNPGCKIIDLGLSRLPEHEAKLSGTLSNLAPELVYAVIQPNAKALFKYTQAADIWNIGMSLSILLNGYYYFSGQTVLQERKQHKAVFGGKVFGTHRHISGPASCNATYMVNGGSSSDPVDHNYLSMDGQQLVDLNALGRFGMKKAASLPNISQKVLNMLDPRDQGRRDFFHAIQRDLKNSFGRPEEFKKTFAHFLLGGEKAEDVATSINGWNPWSDGAKMDRWGGLLNGNPVKRLDVNQALRHPWLMEHSVGLVSDRFRGAVGEEELGGSSGDEDGAEQALGEKQKGGATIDKPTMAEMNLALGLGSLFGSAYIFESESFHGSFPSAFDTSPVVDHEPVVDQEPATKQAARVEHSRSSLSLTGMGERMGIYDHATAHAAQRDEDVVVPAQDVVVPAPGAPRLGPQELDVEMMGQLSSLDLNLSGSRDAIGAALEDAVHGPVYSDPARQRRVPFPYQTIHDEAARTPFEELEIDPEATTHSMPPSSRTARSRSPLFRRSRSPLFRRSRDSISF